jgi:hypothetical protein
VAFVRKKRVGPYEYHQLVESRLVDSKPRQRVLLHLGRYATVEAALKGWLKEVEGFAGSPATGETRPSGTRRSVR